ncbi:MAG TPA: 3'(2'),5'-bisphosphate nucleotidase CysQ [Ohtaekwangia sp.]|nr:3'(2'),5'-bisphosphate nucleotidase CysQ [Ohtaekwangia sp.]
MDIQNNLLTAIQAAEEASKVILEVYNTGDFEAEAKGDNSPLTIADKRGHGVIAVILEATNIPLLSEEGKQIPYDERKAWEYFWMVDPLDGTKEFIKRNGDFTVNIALIHNHTPILGVVAVPVTGEVFYASKGSGAFVKRNQKTEALPKRRNWTLTEPGLRVVASRSHMSDETQQFINSLKEPVLVSRGSSLKFMLLAEGKADVYPRYAPTMEWDTAAAHAIVNETGLRVLRHNSEEELLYNKENLLNPYFLVK